METDTKPNRLAFACPEMRADERARVETDISAADSHLACPISRAVVGDARKVGREVASIAHCVSGNARGGTERAWKRTCRRRIRTLRVRKRARTFLARVKSDAKSADVADACPYSRAGQETRAISDMCEAPVPSSCPSLRAAR